MLVSWPERIEELKEIVQSYLQNPLGFPRESYAYADILEQRGVFQPSELLATGGIEEAILFCEALFDESLGIIRIIKSDEHLIIRDLPAELSSDSWDFNKEYFVVQALNLLRAAFDYIDRVLPTVRRQASQQEEDTGWRVEDFKRELIDVMTGFSYFASLYDKQPILSQYFDAFCQRILSRLQDKVKEDLSRVQKILRALFVYSIPERSRVKRALNKLRELFPFSDQVWDVVTLDRQLKTFTFTVPMGKLGPRQYVEFALIALGGAKTAASIVQRSFDEICKRVLVQVKQMAQQDFSAADQNEIKTILEMFFLSIADSSSTACFEELMPDWYQRCNVKERAILSPYLNFLLSRKRLNIPLTGFLPHVQNQAILPPRQYALLVFGHFDEALCTVLHSRFHASFLLQNEALEIARKEAGKDQDRQLSLESLVGVPSTAPSSKKLRKYISSNIGSIDVMLVEHNTGLGSNSPEFIRHRVLSILHPDVKQVFWHDHHKRMAGHMHRVGEYLLESTKNNVSLPGRAVGMFLTFHPQQVGSNRFLTIRIAFYEALKELHKIKLHHVFSSTDYTAEQIKLLELLMTLKQLQLNQFYQQKHWLKQKVGDWENEPTPQVLLKWVPLPTVLELTPGKIADTCYDQWMAILSGMIDYVAGSFSSVSSCYKIALTQSTDGNLAGFVLTGDIFLNAYYNQMQKAFLQAPTQSSHFGVIPSVIHAAPMDLNTTQSELFSIILRRNTIARAFLESRKGFLSVQERVVSQGQMMLWTSQSSMRGCIGLVRKSMGMLSKALPHFNRCFLSMAEFSRQQATPEKVLELLVGATFHREFAVLAELMQPHLYRRLTAMDIYTQVLVGIVSSDATFLAAKKIAAEKVFIVVLPHLSFYEAIQFYQIVHSNSPFSKCHPQVAALLQERLSSEDEAWVQSVLGSKKKLTVFRGMGEKLLEMMRRSLLQEILLSPRTSLQAFLEEQEESQQRDPLLWGLSLDVIHFIFKGEPQTLRLLINHFNDLGSLGWLDQRSLWQKMWGKRPEESEEHQALLGANIG